MVASPSPRMTNPKGAWSVYVTYLILDAQIVCTSCTIFIMSPFWNSGQKWVKEGRTRVKLAAFLHYDSK